MMRNGLLGTTLNAYQLLLWNQSITRQENSWPQTWILTSEVIGEECTKKTRLEYEKWVGETPCKRVHSWNGTNLTWWPDEPKWYWTLPPSENSPQCHDSPSNDSLLNCSTTGEMNPFRGVPEIDKYWNNLTNTDPGWWRAPDGLFWICGKWAYTELPGTWKGSCTIKSYSTYLGFFLLPNHQEEQMGVPLFELWGWE
jgi:hypothetical protein